VTRDLRPLFAPASVAVVGASSDPAKWGHALARGALAGEARRTVYLVNRRGGEILGRPAHASLAELPGPAELVVLAVPAAEFDDAVDGALAAGARAIVAITAGLGERDEDGRARERAAVERVRAAGAVLLGPNCLGVADAASELTLAWSELPQGALGLITQSGNLALELGLLARDAGVGFSRFASLGNQADLEAVDLLVDFAAHEQTRAIALYVEDFRDGRAFARAAQAAGKPVLLLTAGRSDAGARAARSHTGALVSELAAVEAACRASGIVRVSTPSELVDVAQAVLAAPRPRGRRVAIVGDGGGHGVVAADVADALGLELPRLSDELSARVADGLPPTAARRNPVDLAGGGEQDVSSYARVGGELLRSGEADAVLLTGYFGGYGGAGELDAARGLARAAAEAERPLVAHTMYPRSPAAAALRDGGVPVYRTIEAAAGVLARLAERPEPRGVPALPPAAGGGEAGDDYWAARELVAAAGIECSEALRVRTTGEAEAAADELGFPLVLKALATRHKSDDGGVVAGIADAQALREAIAGLELRLSAPEYSLERMEPRAEGVELILGVRRDARFGPVAVVGIGGVHAELFTDVAVALAPVDAGEAEELIRSLRGAPLLTGARGRPPLALAAAAEASAALSRAAAARPAVAELEVNPLLVLRDRVIALDARCTVAR
jgi:acyl-CoA synthetase (NDP forming)